ncbi:MAG: hypothetical protein AB1758_22990 [Candidatus Eremiobacterota bacterium]
MVIQTAVPQGSQAYQPQSAASPAGGDRFVPSLSKASLEKVGITALATGAAAGVGALGGLATGSLGALLGIPAGIVGGAVAGAILCTAPVWGHHDGSVVGGMMVFGGMTGAGAGLAGGIAAALAPAHPILAGAAAAGAVALGAGIYYGWVVN